MSHRLDRLRQQRAVTRHTLGWLGIAAASIALAAFTVTCSAQTADAGLMLRPGIDTEVSVEELPADGWYRITHKADALQVRPVAAPRSAAGEEEAEEIDTRYIRIPGAHIAEGRLPTVAFSRGVLTPRIAHAYQLALGGTQFTLTVHNGFRNAAGVPYGQGAVYSVNVGDHSYSFHVDSPVGWESRILAAADLDSDGMPDFIVQTGDEEALLLSSRAQPGLNPPAAVLSLGHGC